MSNEAGQGTITMSAAAADAKHPCEQGILASLGVFLDTIVICTLTGFVVVMAHCWTGEGAEAWAALDKLPKFTESIAVADTGNIHECDHDIFGNIVLRIVCIYLSSGYDQLLRNCSQPNPQRCSLH